MDIAIALQVCPVIVLDVGQDIEARNDYVDRIARTQVLGRGFDGRQRIVDCTQPLSVLDGNQQPLTDVSLTLSRSTSTHSVI